MGGLNLTVMIGAVMQNLAFDKLPVNWFDGVVLALLIAGVFRGRKNGMTKEVLPLLKWVSLVLVCGFWYQPVGQLLMNTAGLDRSSGYIFGYLLLAFAVWLLFLALKRLFVYRLGGSNFFGGAEYYLGMLSGLIRYACILLAVLALLNAPVYTVADIQTRDAYVKRWYGGGLYSGNYFPDLQTVQQQVFKTSFTGPYLKDYLGFLLIETTPLAAKPDQKTPVINIQK